MLFRSVLQIAIFAAILEISFKKTENAEFLFIFIELDYSSVVIKLVANIFLFLVKVAFTIMMITPII